MKSALKGPWPILVFVILFLLIPLSTFPGLFEVAFIVIGLIALVIAGLIVASLVSALRERRAPSDAQRTE